MKRILWVGFTAEKRIEQLERSPRLITTFRRGEKWYITGRTMIGEKVELVNCGKFHEGPCDPKKCEVFATAVVVSVKLCRFKDIDPTDYERQSSDNTVEEMRSTMSAVYACEYLDEDITTVITLEKAELL